jgi:hypothetical protein
MFQRYNITSDEDLEDAMERVSAYVTKRMAKTPKIVPINPAGKAQAQRKVA